MVEQLRAIGQEQSCPKVIQKLKWYITDWPTDRPTNRYSELKSHVHVVFVTVNRTDWINDNNLKTWCYWQTNGPSVRWIDWSQPRGSTKFIQWLLVLHCCWTFPSRLSPTTQLVLSAFLDASTHLHKMVCPSVRRSLCPSLCRCVHP